MKNPQTLMIQGTGSDAGKSIIVTALCRILSRNGISVAPFKAQNIALNSVVTSKGGEIGRAQAVQALACGLLPSVDMNPILIKPSEGVGAQLILHGSALNGADAKRFFSNSKQLLLPEALKAYQRLQKDYSVIVIEGSGSPAEINLRDRDVANMGLAEAIDCPVVIVVDIEKGGAFAHLYGTYQLLSDTEKARVVGFIINRYRGDKSLLEPGMQMLQEKTGIPTIGVIPYIENLYIDAEDTIDISQPAIKAETKLKIVIIAYPHISNHTDFDILRLHHSIDCEFVRDTRLFSGADIIILPGSKSVCSDLKWLRDNDWERVLLKHLRYGGKVIGICGGYQMLGKFIYDPDYVESELGMVKGLSLLEVETTLTKHKKLTNVLGECVLNGLAVKGYELHVGNTIGDELRRPLFLLRNIQSKEKIYSEGCINVDNNIIGTYLHGLFDGEAMIDYIFAWFGLMNSEKLDIDARREDELTKLANEVESAIPFSVLTKLLSFNEKQKSRVTGGAGIFLNMNSEKQEVVTREGFVENKCDKQFCN